MGGNGEITVLLTRPEAAGAAFEARLRAAVPGPWACLSAPLIRIAPLAPPEIPEGAELILTSAAALAALPALPGRRAWCVGPGTAAAARAAGMEATAAEGDARSLIALLLRARPAAPLLHLRGEHAAADVAGALRAAGMEAREAVVYRQEALGLSAEALALLAGEAPVLAPLFSPRSAALFEAAAEGARAPLVRVAISAAAARACRGPADVAARPDAEAMIAAVAARLRGAGERAK